MNGTNNEPFFQETKKLKRERFKWVTLLLTTNLLTFLLFLPANEIEDKAVKPWPETWPQVVLKAQIIASGELPLPVTILNQYQQVIFKKAYLVDVKEGHFRIAPEEMTALSNQDDLKVLPYSETIQAKPMAKQRVQYEIHF